MQRRWRVAVGGIGHETNTFSPVQTQYHDFWFRRGDELADEAVLGAEGANEAEILPLFVARALPSGTVARTAYERLKGQLLAELREAMPVDGLLLELHGAMDVEGIGDGESDLIASVRGLIGSAPLVSVSLDLHGNVAPGLVSGADTLTALRTAPHRDGPETRRRAMANLLHGLRTGERPTPALIKVPLLLAGEAAMTTVEPAQGLYAQVRRMASAPGILDASLLVGCAWTDGPFTSASVIVVAESEPDLARQEAARLARAVFARRHEFCFGQETAPLDSALAIAMTAPQSPVFVTDSGDNVTAGAAGDLPIVARRLLELDARDALVAGLADAESVEMCAAAGRGAEIDLAVGAKLDTAHGEPLRIRARVTGLYEGPDGVVDVACVSCRGVSIILTADRRLFIDRRSISEVGFDPMAQQIVVVKQGYLFPDLVDHAPRAIMALSPGAGDQQIDRLPYQNIPRPVYPLDGPFEWEPS